MARTFAIVEQDNSVWYIAKMYPILFWFMPKYLLLSPPMPTGLGKTQMRLRVWVWRRSRATAFATRHEASRSLRLRNNEYLVAVDR